MMSSGFRIPKEKYDAMNAASLDSREEFWLEASRGLDWKEEPTRALDFDSPPFASWFPDGKINLSYNALDRHVHSDRKDQTAIVYESAVGGRSRSITYAELLKDVESFAGSLRDMGVEAGDTVIIYLPMIPEACVAMLACTRIGAVHSVVFGGFASAELAVRIDAAAPKVVITSTCGIEGAKGAISYIPNVREAIDACSHRVPSVVVVDRPEIPEMSLKASEREDDRFVDYNELLRSPTTAAAVPMLSSAPLYTIYTSGTTGDPKGVVRDHSHVVTLKWSMDTFFGHRPGETFFAASDLGWVVGHSYIVYAPLLHGSTSVLYEGKPVGTPDASAYWKIVEKHGVANLFTAPTALRAIRKEDPTLSMSQDYDLSSLRALFVAGERCDPDTVDFFQRALKRPVVDHFWQTESGSPMVGLQREDVGTRAGSCGMPLPGYDLRVIDETTCKEVPVGEMGTIALKLPLPPGFMSTLWKADERFVDTYMTDIPGFYTAMDAGYVDNDGYVSIMSRTDDILNVAGHRLSSGAMEEAVLRHPDVVECAVIGQKHDIKGEVPVAVVVMAEGSCAKSDEVKREVVSVVRKRVGAVAALRQVATVSALPKTRSGKILRKIIRKIADGEEYTVPGTIEDASVLGGIHEAFPGRG